MKPTHTKCWARNLLMLDLTFGPASRSNDGSLALVSCLSGRYKFASFFFRCIGLVIICLNYEFINHTCLDRIFVDFL